MKYYVLWSGILLICLHTDELKYPNLALNPQGLISCWPTLGSYNSLNSSRKAFYKI